jgi:hypothetical protein
MMEASDLHVQDHVFPVLHVASGQQEHPPELHVSHANENPWSRMPTSRNSVDSVDCLPLHHLSKAVGLKKKLYFCKNLE